MGDRNLSARVPFDTFSLVTYPPVQRSQAFNSADALIVEAALHESASVETIVVVNDEFGALCVATGANTLWTDSWLAQHSSQANLARNQREPVRVVWSHEAPTIAPLNIELVLLRVPKQLAYFEYQLSTLGSLLPTGVPLIAAGMDKHLFSNTAQLLERYIGPTQRHRGKRKARLFRAVRADGPVPLFEGHSEFYSEMLDGQLLSFANGFSRDKVDIGSRFLIEKFSLLAPAKRMIDLASGNGILGLSALKLDVAQQLVVCDESAMALAAARANANANLAGAEIQYHHGDGLLDYKGDPADLILCNPPFHHNHRVDSAVGKRLLVQSAKHLKRGGRLCVVANRHLDYLPVLKREFAQVDKLAQNSKFILWLARR